MDTAEIQARLLAMEARLAEDGHEGVGARIGISTGLSEGYIRVDGANVENGKEFTFLYAPTPEKTLERIEALAAKVKPVDQARKEKLMADLGKLIDEGNAIGLEVEFLNPLTETMRKLSENVLEAPQ